MTEQIKCSDCGKDCTKTKEQLETCALCKEKSCKMCVDAETTERQTCGCDWICEYCRGGPNECKDCYRSGCSKCMWTTCGGCHDDAKQNKPELMCNECGIFCLICQSVSCASHMIRCELTFESGEKSVKRLRHVCVRCIEFSLSKTYVFTLKEDATDGRSETRKRKRGEADSNDNENAST